MMFGSKAAQQRRGAPDRGEYRQAAGTVGQALVSAPREGRLTCFETVLCDLLPVCQQKPAFGHNEPRPSVPAIVAAVGLANALSCFDATVVAFGHRSIMIPKAYLFLSR